MGLFSKSSSKNTTTNDYAYDQSTSNVDNSVTETNWSDYSNRSLNDNSDNSMTTTVSDNSNRSISDYSQVDNSFALDFADNSNRSVNDNSSHNWLDNSDNSLKVNMSDTSNRSVNDYSDNSHTTINNTDGGAFSFASESQKQTYGAVNNLVSKSYESINTANDLSADLQKTAYGAMNEVVESSNDLIGKTNSSAIDFVKKSSSEMMGFVNGIVTKSMENMAGLAGQSLAGAMNIKAGETISDPADQNLKTLVKAGVAVAGIGGLIYLMRKK